MADLIEEQKTEATLTVTTTKRKRYPVMATAISGVIVGLTLIMLAYMVGPDKNVYPVTYIICISGYLFGWIIAIISTPMDKTDGDNLGKFTKVAGTFLSGYVLSKLDRVFQQMFDPAQLLNGASLTGTRVLLFICCFALTFIVVFYYREYKYSQKYSTAS